MRPGGSGGVVECAEVAVQQSTAIWGAKNECVSHDPPLTCLEQVCYLFHLQSLIGVMLHFVKPRLHTTDLLINVWATRLQNIHRNLWANVHIQLVILMNSSKVSASPKTVHAVPWKLYCVSIKSSVPVKNNRKTRRFKSLAKVSPGAIQVQNGCCEQ